MSHSQNVALQQDQYGMSYIRIFLESVKIHCPGYWLGQSLWTSLSVDASNLSVLFHRVLTTERHLQPRNKTHYGSHNFIFLLLSALKSSTVDTHKTFIYFNQMLTLASDYGSSLGWWLKSVLLAKLNNLSELFWPGGVWCVMFSMTWIETVKKKKSLLCTAKLETRYNHLHLLNRAKHIFKQHNYFRTTGYPSVQPTNDPI